MQPMVIRLHIDVVGALVMTFSCYSALEIVCAITITIICDHVIHRSMYWILKLIPKLQYHVSYLFSCSFLFLLILCFVYLL